MKSILIIISFAIVSTALAAPVDFPGLIARTSPQVEASDLVYQGKVLLAEEAMQLARKGIDLSSLDPVTTSDLWKRQNLPAALSTETLNVSPSGENVQYLADLISRVGDFRFTVSHGDAQGMRRNYTILLSKKAHNILLRKALLEKIGYRIPAVQHLSQVKVQFSGAFTRKTFIENIRKNTFGDAERWVLNLADTNSTDVILQDALIFSADDAIYNLALGSLTSEVIQGRRLLNSLLVPFNLTDIPESLNLYSWQPGRIVTDGIYLPYEMAEAFTTTFADGRWMALQIAALTKKDFAEIAQRGHFPLEVQLLVAEKMAGRRNGLMKLFDIKTADIAINPQISSGSKLVNGKLESQEWPGFASRFSYGDPPSPLSGPEIYAFFKSKFFSSVLANVVVQFNQQILPHTNVAAKLYEHQVDAAYEQFKELIKTGNVSKIPVGVFATPVLSGNLILSRDIVAGNYLGTQNMVQLADSFGFSMNAGIYAQVVGLQTPVGVSGQAGVFMNRVYAHLKPIKSIRAALKEPFKNALIPLLRRDLSQTFESLLTLDGTQTPSPEQTAKIQASLAEFGKLLGQGESLIITDSYGANLALNVGQGLDSVLSVKIGAQDSQAVVRRLQILKKDDDTIQIYRDPASTNTFSIAHGLSAKNVPIMQISYGRKAGHAQTDFFTLNINPDLNGNPDLIANLQVLRSVLLSNSVEELTAIQKPFNVSHQFNAKEFGASFLFFKWNSQRILDQITVKSPEGFAKDFIYRTDGVRYGKDYQSLAADILEGVIREKTGDDNSVISNPGSGNPGDTLYGTSVARVATFEAEKDPEGALNQAFVNVTHRYKGWKIDRAGAEKIMQSLNAKYQTQFFWPQALNDTKNIELYNIDLQIYIYSEALVALASMSPNATKEMLMTYGTFPMAPKPPCLTPRDVVSPPCVKKLLTEKFIKMQSEYLALQQRGKALEASAIGLKMVSTAESMLPGNVFVAALGGPKNVFIQSRIQGFREKDEAGETAILSNTLGQIGAAKPSGPLHYVQNNLQMTESEFFINWLITPL